HLRAPVLERIVAPELGDDRVLQRVGAADRRVLGHPARERVARRRLHVLRRVEVGLAHRQIHDVLTLLSERRRLGRHGERGRRFHGLQTRGYLHAPAAKRLARSISLGTTLSGSSPATFPPRPSTSFTSRELV